MCSRWGNIQMRIGEHPKKDRPYTEEFVPAVAMPYYQIKENYFFDKATVTLGSDTQGATIFYTLDGSEPTLDSKRYTNPFKLDKTTEIKFFAQKEGLLSSTVVATKIEKLKKVSVSDLEIMKELISYPD